MSQDDLTVWIEKLKQSDDRATDVIWAECFERLVSYANSKLGNLPRRATDEEDVALSALHSFVRQAKGNEFQRLLDSNDLWRLLFTITSRKAVAAQRKHFAKKRGGGNVRGESVFQQGENDGQANGLEQIFTTKPSAGFAESLGELLDELIDQLPDDQNRKILSMKLEGYTTREIADECGTVTRTIERRFAIINELGRQIADKYELS
ncbi:MAG: RNA polymerase subunit sigma-70 [Blastopirellula sp.]|nr:MAG: RNA polymerase subunit sigma-70 [Blastopirellula sp.]